MKSISRAFILAYLTMNSACLGLNLPSCDDRVLLERHSLNNLYTATVFERDCGATADFSTMVNLRQSSDDFHGDNNVVLVVKGQHHVTVEWADDSKVAFRCRDCSPDQVFKQSRSFGSIEITYEFSGAK